MEQKHMLMSALGVGIGVGVGIGLASGQTVSKWTGSTPTNAVTPERMEHEMVGLLVDGKDTKVTFDEFPYYLRWMDASLPTLFLLILLHFVSILQKPGLLLEYWAPEANFMVGARYILLRENKINGKSI